MLLVLLTSGAVSDLFFVYIVVEHWLLATECDFIAIGLSWSLHPCHTETLLTSTPIQFTDSPVDKHALHVHVHAALSAHTAQHVVMPTTSQFFNFVIKIQITKYTKNITHRKFGAAPDGSHSLAGVMKIDQIPTLC